MKRNCNLELRLLPPFVSCHENMMEESSSSGTPQREESQQMTIFYNGRICACDVTELQARSTIMLANREMEEKSRSPNGSDPISPNMNTMQSHHHQVCSPNGGASMKRSLELFLQKRKNRIQSSSPYQQ